MGKEALYKELEKEVLIIDENVLISVGATIIGLAIIEDNSIIEAGSVITKMKGDSKKNLRNL